MSKRKQAPAATSAANPVEAGRSGPIPDSGVSLQDVSLQTGANRIALYTAVAFYLGWLLFLLLAAWGVIR